MLDIKKTVKRNPELLSTRTRAKAFFADVYYDDKPKINVLMNAYDIGIIDALADSSTFSKSRVISNIVSKYAVREDMAKKAVEIWESILSPDVITAIKNIEHKEQEAADARLREYLSANDTENELDEYSDLESKKDDYESYYVNPLIERRGNRIYIPCGYGNTDNGFFIYGIVKQNICRHPYGSIYALVYNFLIRNSKMTENDVPSFITSKNSLFDLDYKNIYRLAIILLQLIKNNYMPEDTLSLNYRGDVNELKYAIGLINNYADMFCKIIGIPSIKLKVRLDAAAVTVSLIGEKGIYVKNNTEISSNAREIWYGKKINYKINVEDTDTKAALRRLLMEVSSFTSFKDGQLAALASMMNSGKNSVCIMPTGSGKSLIYYLASILQPIPIFVISPTDILIRDQIRNLRKFHRIDNVAHLQLTGENSFKNYSIQCNINFLTPMTFQNSNLLAAFRLINNGEEYIHLTQSDVQFRIDKISASPLAAYIVLDEIHCLSNWGHDFRPEYLMLSTYLNKYLDRINLWGFTATANYTVVEDIQKQLGLLQENIYSPITFDKYNVSYDYRPVESMNDMYETLKNVVSRFISRGERTLVFTKDEDTAIKVADTIGYEADVFQSDNPESYYQFVEGKCCVLVATEELGIGINLPNIKNVINFGLPLSKDSYVQEIGRAGRENGNVNSVVIYLNPSEQNIPTILLRRDTTIPDMLSAVLKLNNDYADIYHKITNNCPSEDAMRMRLMDFYKSLRKTGRAIFSKAYDVKDVDSTKQLLFMLYVCGYIKDWYAYSISDDGNEINILIDICSTRNKSSGINNKEIFQRMRSRIKDYFELLGNNREMIVKADRAETQEDIISLYVDWYYKRFLYLHKEQFIDLFEFIQRNSKCDAVAIAEEVQDYFSLPFAKIKLEESQFAEMSLVEIGRKGITGISRALMADIERINSNNYSYKNDFLLFCGHLRINSLFDESRLIRVLDNVNSSDKHVILDVLVEAYGVCNLLVKMNIANFIERSGSQLNCSISDYLEAVYNKYDKDEIYYGILSYRLNKAFSL